MEQLSFGQWLRRKRKSLDLTREELAERVGYSAATIRKIEDEERHPSVEVVARLAEFFNIPPDERTIFLQFARGERKSAPTQTIEETPWHVSTKSIASNLPAATTSLIGREKEIADVREYFIKEDVRLVTLTGPPGIGKTRLSIEAARTMLPDFRDGIFFVALAPLDNPALIAVIVAQTLGYIGARNGSTREQLKEGIGEKHLLLVLDNCEHLIEEVASLASFLLSACSRLRILATSRESLRIPGEWQYLLPTFDLPAEHSSISLEAISKFPALKLFAERARAVRPDFTLNIENIGTVKAICAQLDGLPLVIELIAARLRLMPPEALLMRLNEQFILSADGMRAASARQRTLSDAIQWSYNLLSAEEQKGFAYLSVFSGGFTLDAAEDICSPGEVGKSISNLIASLLDKSLLQFEAVQQAERGNPCYTMLVTIREFARNRLRLMGKETELRNRHLAYFLGPARRANQELRGPNQILWLQRLEIMRDNLRSALDWAIETGQTESALELGRDLHWFWFIRGDHAEGCQWLGRVLEMPETLLYPEAQTEALTQQAHHLFLKEGERMTRPVIEQALTMAQKHRDKHNTARALVILGLVYMYENNFASAQETIEKSKALYQQVQDEWGYAHAAMCLAWNAFYQNDYESALTVNEQARTLFTAFGDKYFEVVTLRLTGYLLVKKGDWTSGMPTLREALRLAQELGSKYEIALTLWRFEEVARMAGKFIRAVHLYGATKSILDSIGALTEADQLTFEKDLAHCYSVLGELAFKDAMEEGRAMTMEESITYALSE